MKVLLINPACLDLRLTDDDAAVVPIGLYYLAAQLLDQGIASGILNLAAVASPPNSGSPTAQPASRLKESGTDLDAAMATFEAALARERPDVIGFSVTNPTRFSAMACAHRAKVLLPETTVVFGGPAPTFMAPHLFEACPELDVAVRGEGEASFPALVKALASKGTDLSLIKGLVFRSGKKLIDTGLPAPIEDLDSLARPSKYFTFQHLSMSRGCPGRCTFCGSPKFWGTSRVRRHSADWFFEEIRGLNAKGVGHFFISDDTFTQDREAVLRLCDSIEKSGLAITWNAISRVDCVDGELLSAMRRAGCIQISYGVESGAPAVRKVLGKPMDDDTCINAFELTRSMGILPRAYFIYGSPGETQETIDQSIALIKRLKPLSTVFYMLVVFPGTHLYTRARDKGLVSDAIWYENIEDLPWYELDPELDFKTVKHFGDQLRLAFFSNLEASVLSLDLKEDPSLAASHADFLSRLGMTFSQGEYAADPRVPKASDLARHLFEKALTFGPDARAFLGLSMMLQKIKNFSAAIELLDRGLTHFPDHRDLTVGKGVCCMNMGRFQQALDCFTPFDSDPALGHYITICKSRITR